MNRKTSASLLFAATLLSGVSFFPLPVKAAVTPIEDWHVSPVMPKQEGLSPYCALASRYADGMIVTHARNSKGKGTIAIQFPWAGFEKGQNYRVELTVGDAALRAFAATATNEDLLIIKTGQDAELFQALQDGQSVAISMENGRIRHELEGAGNSFVELADCVQGLAPATSETEQEFNPTPLKKDEAQKLGRVITERDTPRKTAPVKKGYVETNSNAPNAAAPAERTVAKANPAGIPVTKTAPKLKSGYVSNKQRLYEPEAPREDLAMEERAEGLKEMLNRARAEAGVQPVAETERPIEMAQAPKVKASQPVPPAIQEEEAMATATTPQETAPPPVVENEMVTAPETVTSRAPARIEPARKAAPQATPTQLSRVSEAKPAPALKYEAPTAAPLKQAAPQKTKPLPVITETTVIEPTLARPSSEETEEPVQAEPAQVPQPQQADVATRSAPVKPVTEEKPRKKRLPPIHFDNERQPVGEWTLDITDNANREAQSYCSLANQFDDTNRLILTRAVDGSGSIGLNMGVNLLERGRKYAVTVKVGRSFEKEYTARAASANMMIIQLGNSDPFYQSLGYEEAMLLAMPGMKLSFNVSGVKQKLGAFDSCMATLDGDAVKQNLSNDVMTMPLVTETTEKKTPENEIPTEKSVARPVYMGEPIPYSVDSILRAANINIETLQSYDDKGTAYVWKQADGAVKGSVIGLQKENPDQSVRATIENDLEKLKQLCPSAFLMRIGKTFTMDQQIVAHAETSCRGEGVYARDAFIYHDMGYNTVRWRLTTTDDAFQSLLSERNKLSAVIQKRAAFMDSNE